MSRIREDAVVAANRRDAALELSAQAMSDAWKAKIEKEIERWAKTGVAFTSEDIIRGVGHPACDHRAIGGIIRGYSQREKIVPVGWTTAKSVTRNAAPIRVWRGA